MTQIHHISITEYALGISLYDMTQTHHTSITDYVLGISLFQQGAPELVDIFRVDVDQFAITGWQEVIDHHVDPLAKPPELEVEDSGVFLRMFIVPLLVLMLRDHLRSNFLHLFSSYPQHVESI